MASATLRQIHAAHLAALPVPADDYEWVYDDPDLAPFAGRPAPRKEVSLEDFV
jgi:hypothetical protein